MDVRMLARIAALGGVRLALLDEDGHEVPPMTDEGARDSSRRRLPAHLDTVHSEKRPGRYQDRYYRRQPTYTFDLDRSFRDLLRERHGTPDDHHVEQPGDSPAARAEARRAAAHRRDAEARQRALESGAWDHVWLDFVCECPPQCDELDDRNGKPVHAEHCGCGCDVG
jgi:hypothetical protein